MPVIAQHRSTFLSTIKAETSYSLNVEEIWSERKNTYLPHPHERQKQKIFPSEQQNPFFFLIFSSFHGHCVYQPINTIW